MPNKLQEKFCVKEFDRWLKDRFRTSTSLTPEENDPPDWWLILHGQKYAVEVTAIQVENDRTAMTSLSRLVKDTSVQAVNAGELSGTYLVAFEGRVAQMRKVKKSIQDCLLKYVRASASAENEACEAIRVDGTVVCTIRKLHSKGAVLYPAGSVHNTGCWEGEIRIELTELLHDRLSAKSKFAKTTEFPSILILYDLYRLADRGLFIECIRGIDDMTLFHTIYVVEDIGTGYVAHSRFDSAK